MRLHGAQRGLTAVLVAVPLAASLLALTSCSTVDRSPGDECLDDIDCGTGSVCSLAQGNKCVPEELPPQAVIGFEINEKIGDDDLRIELTGCDPEVERELGGSELRVQKRSGLINDYLISATTRRAVVNCGGNECAGVCDEQTLTCSEPTEAKFTLSMASRLGLSDRPTTKSPEPAPPVPFIWPSYESELPSAHAALVLEVTPTAEMNQLGAFRRVIAEDADPAIDVIEAIGSLRCQRGLFGVEGGVRTLSGVTVGGASIEFRYAEPIATPSTVIGTAPSCTDDDECPPGWACNDAQGSCGLNLTGVLAGSTISTDELIGGYLEAWVYTYCEETVAPIIPLLREFTVTVTPPAESGLPTLLYALEQPFIDPNPISSVKVDGQLCLPDWQPPQPVSFSVTGEPVKLIETELGAYECCATDCLPTGETGVEPPPPPSIDTCPSSFFQKARFETRWSNTDLIEWGVAGCVPTAKYPDGSNGRYRREVSKCEDAGCSVALTAGHAEDDLNRTYSVAITQPDGSVFQSQRFSVQVDAATSELEPFQLRPRVLLRGTVECVAGSNCVATSAESRAEIRAERLRVDTDDPDLPGPFFFEARVDATGAFVLPLDPGVYVITAYPAVGQPGGPSRFEIVDVREGMTEMVDGVPEATLSDPLQLDDGILVRVALSGFAVSTGVRPLDVGSWKAQDDFPADLYDLNDPQTCYSSNEAGNQGCAIRRLRPNDSTISLLISGRFQFTARNRGDDDCSE